MCPAKIIHMNGKGRFAASESSPGQFVREINELADQWAAWRVPQPLDATPSKHKPKAEVIPFPPPETAEEERAQLNAIIPKLDPGQLKLLRLVSRAFQPDHLEKVPDGPDAELVRQCNRLKAVQAATNAAYQEIPDERKRDLVLDLLYARRFEVKDRLFELGGPQTLEGAHAAASVLLDQYPDGLGREGDLLSWLSFHCAEYLAGKRP